MATSRLVTGGGFVCRPSPIPYRTGLTQGLTLMSDLHVGAPQVDYARITWELERAKEHGDRVLLLGDLIDAILPSDRKRFEPTVLHPRLQGRNDVVNAEVDWVVEILGPYANLIDMVGVGNHETAVEKNHHLDVTRLIVEGLTRRLPRRSRHVIHYGGYTGYVAYAFDGAVKSRQYRIFYHHGSGGGVTLSKVFTQLKSKGWSGADLIWEGHRHLSLNAREQVLELPDAGHDIRSRDIRYVATGGYFHTYEGQPQGSIRSHGRRSNYAADSGLFPTGVGGASVLLSFGTAGRDLLVQVLQ